MFSKKKILFATFKLYSADYKTPTAIMVFSEQDSIFPVPNLDCYFYCSSQEFICFLKILMIRL